jgi:DNA polymerase-3 subunit epsilon
MLKLRRPLVIYDLETTGTEVAHDRIVEISTLKVFPDGTREAKTRRLHPGRPIPPGASAVHGIFDADVAELPGFGRIAKGLWAYLAGCDLCTFNGKRFDVPLLAEEFGRAALEFPAPDAAHVDLSEIYRLLNPRTLTAAVAQYLGCDHANAHTAEADTTATFDLLHVLIAGPLTHFLKDQAGLDAEEFFSPAGLSDFGEGLHHGRVRIIRIDPLGKLVRNEQGTIVWNFGAHAGKPVVQTDPGFINWVLNKDFPEATKMTLRKVLKGELV